MQAPPRLPRGACCLAAPLTPLSLPARRRAQGPPPIKNGGLLVAASTAANSPPQLLLNLHHGSDYVLVPPRLWSAFSAWYGGGPAIQRKVVCVKGALELELYPPVLHCYRSARRVLLYRPDTPQCGAHRAWLGPPLPPHPVAP